MAEICLPYTLPKGGARALERMFPGSPSVGRGIYNGVLVKWLRDAPLPTEEELSAMLATPDWKDARRERDNLLSSCDWTQGADSPLTVDQKAAWATYRQALRDITKNAAPETVIWPASPGVLK